MTTGQPLYLRIRDRIRAEILYQQGLGPGSRLPTERELQLRFGVSRPTIAKALAALASEGELVASQGRGRFAAARNGVMRSSEARRRIGYVATIATETLTQRAFSGIERVARRSGYGVVMASANDRVDQEREAVHDLIASGTCGIIVYPVPRPVQMDGPDYLSAETFNVPIVLFDTGMPHQGHTQFLFDNERACYGLTTWLIEHGHTSIAYAVGDAGIRHGPLLARVRGYVNALTDKGLGCREDLVAHYQYNDRGVIGELAARFAGMENRPTALIATDDMAAVEFIERFDALGLRVPDDIQVVGFDDREEARRLRHQFSTTRPDFERLGELACEELIRLVRGDVPSGGSFVLEVPLVIRRHPSVRVTEDAARLPVHARISDETFTRVGPSEGRNALPDVVL